MKQRSALENQRLTVLISEMPSAAGGNRKEIPFQAGSKGVAERKFRQQYTQFPTRSKRGSRTIRARGNFPEEGMGQNFGTQFPLIPDPANGFPESIPGTVPDRLDRMRHFSWC